MSFKDALERQKTTGRGRIHDMVIPRETGGKDRVEFDVEKEVGEEEWKGMVKILERYHASIGTDVAITDHFLPYFLCVRLWTLHPEQKDTLGIHDIIASGVAYVSNPGHYDLGETLIRNRERPAVLFAARWCGEISSAEALLTSDLREFTNMELETKREDCAWNLYFLSAEDLFAIDPDEAIKKVGRLDNEEWKGVTNTIVQNVGGQNEDAQAVAFDTVKRIKLLNPKRFAQLPLGIIISALRTRLEKARREKDWYYFSRFVHAMQIISAKEIVMTDHGVEIDQKKQGHKEYVPPRPIRSSF